MRTGQRLFAGVLVFALTSGCAGHVVYASGPYRGRVIDAETRQPLVGVVVLAIWYREVPVAPHGPAVDYHDSIELLTDDSGEFTVPEKTHFTLIGKIREPRLVIYYPGYAAYPSMKARPQGKEVGAAYEQKVFHVELMKSKTLEERRTNVRDLPVSISDIPDDKMPNLVRLVNKERQDLGLQPVRLGR